MLIIENRPKFFLSPFSFKNTLNVEWKNTPYTAPLGIDKERNEGKKKKDKIKLTFKVQNLKKIHKYRSTSTKRRIRRKKKMQSTPFYGFTP